MTIELSLLAKAFNQLSKREISKVQGLFVSVDPKRDSLQKVTDYAQFFHKKIIGARMENPAKLLSFSKQLSSYYKIIAKKEDSLSKNNNYLVSHTSSFILIGPDGRYIGMMSAPHKLVSLSYDIKQLVKLYF